MSTVAIIASSDFSSIALRWLVGALIIVALFLFNRARIHKKTNEQQ